jgi:hypothetical protein
MRKIIYILTFMIGWLIITATVLLWGITYNWPDFVHVDYGLPLVWATNVQGTIAGPVNQWKVNIANLFIDLVFWIAIMIAGTTFLLHKLKTITKS